MPTKPLELHRLQGTRSKTQPVSDSEIVAGAPRCPGHLSKFARAEWRRLLALLLERRTVTPGDELLLAQAAELTARWVTAKRDVQKRGLVIESTVLDSSGQAVTRERKNPFLAIAQESEKALLGILDRLGLVPATRDKVKPAAPNTEAEPQPGTVGYLLKHGGKE